MSVGALSVGCLSVRLQAHSVSVEVDLLWSILRHSTAMNWSTPGSRASLTIGAVAASLAAGLCLYTLWQHQASLASHPQQRRSRGQNGTAAADAESDEAGSEASEDSDASELAEAGDGAAAPQQHARDGGVGGAALGLAQPVAEHLLNSWEDCIPDDLRDPISLGIMLDPVVLCATGQVYDYSTLRAWMSTGNRLCPKTNTYVVDAQVTRLPWLKARGKEWLLSQGLPVLSNDSLDGQLAAIHPELPAWVRDIRSDTGERRQKAATDIYEVLRAGESRTGDPSLDVQDNLVRGAVTDDMVWLLRYGDVYLQGVAASVLAYCDMPDEVQWIAATAAVPAVSLCLCLNSYTSQAATRLLYNISRAGPAARHAIKAAGGVQSLLRIISTDRAEYGYCRDRAAATLAVMAKDEEAAAYLRCHALQPLKALLASDDRWEKRDAATSLLKLQFTPEELSPETNARQLFEFWYGSRAWLDGQVASPNEALTEVEQFARSVLTMQLDVGGSTELLNMLIAQDTDLVIEEPEHGRGEDVEDGTGTSVDEDGSKDESDFESGDGEGEEARAADLIRAGQDEHADGELDAAMQRRGVVRVEEVAGEGQGADGQAEEH